MVVAPDALNPSILSSRPGNSGAAAAPPAVNMSNPDNLAALMPTGLAGSLPSGARSLESELLSGTPGLISGIKFSGLVSALLNQVTSRLGLSWHYDPQLQGLESPTSTPGPSTSGPLVTTRSSKVSSSPG